MHEYDYSVDQMELERHIHFGREAKRADIVLFEKTHPNVEYLIIAYKMEEDVEAVTSSAFLHFCVKNKAEVMPDYLALVLNSEVVQLQAERDASGAYSPLETW